jgi:ATP synthase protein I
LKRAQSKEAERTGQAPPADANEQLGQRVLSTLLGGLFGGTLIGWLLDRWLGTGPWLLIILMVLGTVGGFWSIFKLTSRRS